MAWFRVPLFRILQNVRQNPLAFFAQLVTAVLVLLFRIFTRPAVSAYIERCRHYNVPLYRPPIT
eukprot:2210822-Pyramimonas_sp.AAC.2